MIQLRFKVDPEYLKHETEVVDPVRIKITNPIDCEMLGESGRIMALDGAIFIVTKELAYKLVREKVAKLI